MLVVKPNNIIRIGQELCCFIRVLSAAIICSYFPWIIGIHEEESSNFLPENFTFVYLVFKKPELGESSCGWVLGGLRVWFKVSQVFPFISSAALPSPLLCSQYPLADATELLRCDLFSHKTFCLLLMCMECVKCSYS